MLLVLLLVMPSLTTRLVPGPATISLDGGYRDILVTIQPRICREGRGQEACARQTLGNLKVLYTCVTEISQEMLCHITRSLIMFGSPQPSDHISCFISTSLWLSVVRVINQNPFSM